MFCFISVALLYIWARYIACGPNHLQITHFLHVYAKYTKHTFREIMHESHLRPLALPLTV